MLRGTILALPPARPVMVASAGGSLWLTLDYDPRDLVLNYGESVLLVGLDRVLAFALEDAVMEVRKVDWWVAW